MRYLLDTNIFIQSYRITYPPDVFGVFWDWLGGKLTEGHIHTISEVYEEIKKGKDELYGWVSNFDSTGWILDVDDPKTQSNFTKVADWVMNHERFRPAAKDTFLECADPWLIAKAISGTMTVVTEEKSAPNSRKKIFIPDVCNEFNIQTISTVQLLRNMGAAFR